MDSDATQISKSLSWGKVFKEFLKRFCIAYSIMCLLIFIVWINEGNPPKNSLF